METVEPYLSRVDGAPDQPYETLDARELPPPKPLRNTLETLAELDDSVSLVQLNDRRPQHLYPKLADRGYRYETLDDEKAVVTVIWKE